MADDVLRTRRLHREKLCARSAFSVSAAVRRSFFKASLSEDRRPNLLAVRGGLHIILKNGAKLIRHIKATEETP